VPRTRLARAARATRPAVALVEPGEPADAEGIVERLVDRGTGIRVELLLDDDTDAVAWLPKLAVAWLDLRNGDLVRVRRVSA
jgi:hypothetical protein